MSEINIVVREIKLTKEGVFDFEDLYKTIKEWLNFHKYDFFEKNYLDKLKEDSKDIKIEIETEKKIDYYLKFLIEIKIVIKDYRLIFSTDKKKKLVRGELIITLFSAIKSDFESKWEGRPLKKFIRGVYDKFVEGDKRQAQNNELKEETYSFYNELKAFLNLQRF